MRGKVCGISFTLLFCEDHPRLCGEKAVPGGAGAAFYGSPPPMRGKVKWLSIVKSCASRDHPRLCGEKDSFHVPWVESPGSPPPMRGKAPTGGELSPESGITPAYAGKSADTATGAVVTEDHPRLCGEKFVCKSHFANGIGSPPPMRGKDHFRDFCARKSRITPAYAGKRYTP